MRITHDLIICAVGRRAREVIQARARRTDGVGVRVCDRARAVDTIASMSSGVVTDPKAMSGALDSEAMKWGLRKTGIGCKYESPVPLVTQGISAMVD